MSPGGPHRDDQEDPRDRRLFSLDDEAWEKFREVLDRPAEVKPGLAALFTGPTDEDRARRRADLIGRAAQVRSAGWEPYRGLWSTGEMIGVAVLLGEDTELAALGETQESAWQRWAFDLWGLDRGQADADNNCAATRQWFLDAANELDSGCAQLALEFGGESLPGDCEAASESDPDMRELVSRAAESPTVRRTRPRRGHGVNRWDGPR